MNINELIGKQGEHVDFALQLLQLRKNPEYLAKAEDTLQGTDFNKVLEFIFSNDRTSLLKGLCYCVVTMAMIVFEEDYKEASFEHWREMTDLTSKTVESLDPQVRAALDLNATYAALDLLDATENMGAGYYLRLHKTGADEQESRNAIIAMISFFHSFFSEASDETREETYQNGLLTLHNVSKEALEDE